MSPFTLALATAQIVPLSEVLSLFFFVFPAHPVKAMVAGLKLSRNRNYTEGELILQLQILAKKIGRSPTTREVGADPDTAAPVTFTQHFGSWDCALHAAGLERRKKR